MKSVGLFMSLLLLVVLAGCGSDSSGKSEAKATSSRSTSASPSASASASPAAGGVPTTCLAAQAVTASIGTAMTLAGTQPGGDHVTCTYLGANKRALQVKVYQLDPTTAASEFQKLRTDFQTQLKIPGDDGGIGKESLVFSNNPQADVVLADDENGTFVLTTFVAPDAATRKAGMLKALDQVLANY